jgi:hypothetical protein
MYAPLLAAIANVWVVSLLLLGLLAAIGFLVYRKGVYGRFRRRLRRTGHHPYQGDAEDFERLLRS